MKTAAIKRLYNTDTNNRRIKRITKKLLSILPIYPPKWTEDKLLKPVTPSEIII
jgi:hypothetical protein